MPPQAPLPASVAGPAAGPPSDEVGRLLTQAQAAHEAALQAATQRAVVAEDAVHDYRRRKNTTERYLEQRTKALRDSEERVEQLRAQLKEAAAAPQAATAVEKFAALQARFTELETELTTALAQARTTTAEAAERLAASNDQLTQELAAALGRNDQLAQDLEAALARIGRRDLTIAEQEDIISQQQQQLSVLISLPKRRA